MYRSNVAYFDSPDALVNVLYADQLNGHAKDAFEAACAESSSGSLIEKWLRSCGFLALSRHEKDVSSTNTFNGHAMMTVR